MNVEKVSGVLIDNNSWISTRISGLIEEVLFSKQRKRVQYLPPIIEIPEVGEAIVNGCRVIAGKYEPIEIGKRYLMFLQEEDWASPIVFTTMQPIRIDDDGRLHSSSATWLDGANIEMVRRRVRSANH